MTGPIWMAATISLSQLRLAFQLREVEIRVSLHVNYCSGRSGEQMRKERNWHDMPHISKLPYELARSCMDSVKLNPCRRRILPHRSRTGWSELVNIVAWCMKYLNHLWNGSSDGIWSTNLILPHSIYWDEAWYILLVDVSWCQVRSGL